MLTKKVKDVLDKNFKSLKKGFEDDNQKVEKSPMLLDSYDQCNKIAIISKAIKRFSAIPIKILTQYFTDLEKNNNQLHMEKHKTQISLNKPIQ